MNVFTGRIFPPSICTSFLLSSQVFIFYKFVFSLYEFLLSISCFIRFIAEVMAPYMLNTYQHRSSARLASFSCQILIYTASKFSTCISSSSFPQQRPSGRENTAVGTFYSPIMHPLFLALFFYAFLFPLQFSFSYFTMGTDEDSPFQGITACFFQG